MHEYETREENCMRKWNNLLQENLKNSNKLNGFKQQLQRQKDSYQNILAKNHEQIAKLNNSIPQVSLYIMNFFFYSDVNSVILILV